MHLLPDDLIEFHVQVLLGGRKNFRQSSSDFIYLPWTFTHMHTDAHKHPEERDLRCR